MFGDEGAAPLTGLAMSGGGFRATLFHLGALIRINEFGYLTKLDRISSVSGGSITNGLLAVRWKRLNFDLVTGIASNFKSLIVDPLRDFCGHSIDAAAIGEGYLPGLLKSATGSSLGLSDVSQHIESHYETLFGGKITLQDIPDSPRFIFNATNFTTGVDFRFSKPYAGDYRIGYIPTPQFTVAFAATCSSAFPPVLSPVVRPQNPDAFRQWQGSDLFEDAKFRSQLFLTDGGVYDNLGLETIEKRCETVLVSDAGGPFQIEAQPSREWVQQSMRAFDVATAQSRALRKRQLLNDLTAGRKKGTYWGTTTDIQNYGLPCLPVSRASTQYVSTMRTRLNAFSEKEQGSLINAGYALCDAAMRRWILNPPPPKPPDYPIPSVPL
jgi:NTE family protein